MASITDSSILPLFERIGLKPEKAKETLKNTVLSNRLLKLVSTMEKDICRKEINQDVGILLYTASSYKWNDDQTMCVLNMIHSNKIKSGSQIIAANDYFKKNIQLPIDVNRLEKACGVGVHYDDKEIEEAVTRAILKLKINKDSDKAKINRGVIIGDVVKDYKWVDMKCLSTLIDSKLNNIVIRNDEQINEQVSEQVNNDKEPYCESESKAANSVFKDWKSVLDATDPKKVFSIGEAAKFHKPGENYTSPNYIVNQNTARLMREHLEKYGNQVRTRFPPEPNGILHIGHAKAINFNFGYAKAFNGITFLRYDDTNPEKEEEKYFTGIREMVEWLGFSPYQITHASDHFDKLYEFAKLLIKKGHAYVCHESHENIKGRNLPSSPWRDRPITESLRLFEDMRNGKFKEGEAVLRLKYTMEDGKTDPVAYRILFTAHHRSGDKWCIYPTYSFTHPICDSLEGITHSLCTKEFQNQRSFYYWLCNTLEIYCPVQWEYSRLNLNYSVVSKRKIVQLIQKKIVLDWNDPRLFTLSGLRRRGIPREAINYFTSKVGVTMAQNVINPSLLYACTRDVLNVMSHRAMAVLTPLKVTLVNMTETVTVSIPYLKSDPNAGMRHITFGNTIYIDSEDFSQNPDKDYRRLSTSQSVGLMHIGKVLVFKEAIKNEKGEIVELKCEIYDSDSVNKPRAFIQWIHEGDRCEIRLFNELFLHSNPEDPKEVPGGYLSDVNPNSLIVKQNALVEKGICGQEVLTSFQFERLGYFCIDIDSTPQKVIFNRTVTLK